MSLVGTTDTDFTDDPATAKATEDDVDYLIDELQQYFPDMAEDDIIYTYAAVRPLYDSGKGGSESDVSRKHKIIEDAGGKNGLITVAGAKITAHRAAAEEAVDTIEARLGRRSLCLTDRQPLPGAVGYSGGPPGAKNDRVQHLYSLYGRRAESVIELGEEDTELQQPLCDHTDDTMAQVVFAVQDEFALTLSDVMLRRLTVGYAECQGLCCAEDVAEKMQELLDWTDERKEQEIEQYQESIESRQAYST